MYEKDLAQHLITAKSMILTVDLDRDLSDVHVEALPGAWWLGYGRVLQILATP